MTIKSQNEHQVLIIVHPSLGPLRAIAFEPKCSCGWKGRATIFRDHANKERREHEQITEREA